jgi:hypothetical protein
LLFAEHLIGRPSSLDWDDPSDSTARGKLEPNIEVMGQAFGRFVWPGVGEVPRQLRTIGVDHCIQEIDKRTAREMDGDRPVFDGSPYGIPQQGCAKQSCQHVVKRCEAYRAADGPWTHSYVERTGNIWISARPNDEN